MPSEIIGLPWCCNAVPNGRGWVEEIVTLCQHALIGYARAVGERYIVLSQS